MVSSTDIVRADAYDDEIETGLEDITVTRTPRFSLDVENGAGVFVNNLTNERLAELECIILGAVRQRTLWSKDIDDQAPKCRSREGKIGNPLDDFPKDEFEELGGAFLDDGKIECASCPMKEWRGDTPPRCSEQLVLPILHQGGVALLTCQRTALANTNTYLSGFQARKVGAFSAATKIQLEVRKKGTNEFAVPTFTKVGETDPDDKKTYLDQLRKVRTWLTKPRAEESESETAGEEKPAIETKSRVVADLGDDNVVF